MAKQKSIYTVKQATAMAFDYQPEIFNGLTLVVLARAIMARPACLDGTILRRLRELRDENPEKYGYEVIDTELSRYKKRKLRPAENFTLKFKSHA